MRKADKIGLVALGVMIAITAGLAYLTFWLFY